MMINSLGLFHSVKVSAHERALRKSVGSNRCLFSQSRITKMPPGKTIRFTPCISMGSLTAPNFFSKKHYSQKKSHHDSFKPILFRSNFEDENVKTNLGIQFFTVIGGVLFGSHLLNHNEDFVHTSSCERKKGVDRPRGLETIDKLAERPNLCIEKDKSSLAVLGLIKDDQKSKKGKDFYEIKGVNCLFRAEITDKGQLVWTSFQQVYDHDVKNLIDFYKKLHPQRVLHVNTGIHGTKDGCASVEGEGCFNPNNFIRHDVEMLLALLETEFGASFHLVSRHSPPITAKRYPRMDILNAWCYSNNTHDFTMGRSVDFNDSDLKHIQDKKIQLKTILKSIPITIGVHPDDFESNTQYVELGGLKEKIYATLNQSSICYVEGIGGLGKSRIALEVEKEIRESINNRNNHSNEKQLPLQSSVKSQADACFETVFISFKSEEKKQSFKQYAEKFIGETDSFKKAVGKYFKFLASLAHLRGEKIFVVIDNIDDNNDIDCLKEIIQINNQFKNSKLESPFKVLITGRFKSDDINNRIQCDCFKPESVVGIQYYVTLSIWNLFTSIVKNECEKIDIKKEIEPFKSEFEALFKEFGHHTGFTVIIAKMIARAYRVGGSSRYNQTRKEIKSNIQLLIGDDDLSDYGRLKAMIQVSLQPLDDEFGVGMSDIARLIALASDGLMNQSFFESTVKSHFKINDVMYLKVIERYLQYGLISSDQSQNNYEIPNFYRQLIRRGLAEEYSINKEKKKLVDDLICTILSIISNNLDSKKDSVYENMKYLLGLFNFSKDLGADCIMYDRISERVAKTATKYSWAIVYSDLKSHWRHFLSEIPIKPGYSIEPALQMFLSSEKLETLIQMQENLCLEIDEKLKKLKEKKVDSQEIQEMQETVKSLNNLYLFIRVRNESAPCLITIKAKLNAVIEKNILDEFTQKWIKSNLALQEENSFQIFPKIQFQSIPIKQREKAEAWRKENNDKISDIANLSHQYIKEGLRILTYYLLEEKKVKEIDLSCNAMGLYDNDLSALHDLLKYFGSLKTLRLNDNFLHATGRDKQFDQIIGGLKKNRTLETIFLNNNSLREKRVTKICEAFKEHPKIRVIELQGNPLTENDVQELKKLMENNSNIQLITIHKDGCWIGPIHSRGKKIKRINGKVEFVSS